ncbi:hypothetical protein PR048_026770, partial [Dryococelus australis]
MDASSSVDYRRTDVLKILQKNGMVAMRHVDQLRDQGMDDGNWILLHTGCYLHYHQQLMLAMIVLLRWNRGRAVRTRIRALFLGSRSNIVNKTHLWKSSRREPQGKSYLNQGQKSCLLMVLRLRSCDAPSGQEQGPTADIISLYRFSIN